MSLNVFYLEFTFASVTYGRLTPGVFKVLAFARGDVVFIFSFKIFYFLHRTGRYLIYFTVTICILSNNCKQIDY